MTEQVIPDSITRPQYQKQLNLDHVGFEKSRGSSLPEYIRGI
jgi:hypothetical protein